MHRRQFFAGTVALVALSGGCLGGENAVTAPDTTDTSTASPTPTDDTSTESSARPTSTTENGGSEIELFDEYESEDVVESLTAGRNSDEMGPYTIDLWNGGDRERQFDIELSDEEAEEIVYEASPTIRADGWFEATLHRVSSYRLRFRVPEIGAADTHSVPAEQFDCNSTRYFVGVFDDGEVRSMGMSTAMECTAATPTGSA